MPLVENCLAGFNSSVFAYGQVRFSTPFSIHIINVFRLILLCWLVILIIINF